MPDYHCKWNRWLTGELLIFLFSEFCRILRSIGTRRFHQSRKVKILKIIFQPQFLYFFFIKDSFLIKYWILENNLIKVPNFLLEKKRSLKFLYLYLINEISLSINWLLFYTYIFDIFILTYLKRKKEKSEISRRKQKDRKI